MFGNANRHASLQRGLLTEGVSGLSEISRHSRKWSGSPCVSSLLGLSSLDSLARGNFLKETLSRVVGPRFPNPYVVKRLCWGDKKPMPLSRATAATESQRMPSRPCWRGMQKRLMGQVSKPRPFTPVGHTHKGGRTLWRVVLSEKVCFCLTAETPSKNSSKNLLQSNLENILQTLLRNLCYRMTPRYEPNPCHLQSQSWIHRQCEFVSKARTDVVMLDEKPKHHCSHHHHKPPAIYISIAIFRQRTKICVPTRSPSKNVYGEKHHPYEWFCLFV